MSETVTRLLQRQILPLDRDFDVLALYVDPEETAPRRRPLRDRWQPGGEGPQQRRDPAVDLDRRRHPPRPDRVAHHAPREVGRAPVLRHLLQRVPGQLLAALVGRRRRHAHRRARGHRRDGDRLQVDGQGPLAAGGRRVDVRRTAHALQLRAPAQALHRRRLVLVRRGRRRRRRGRVVGGVDRRGAGRPRRARHRRHRHHHDEPPRLRLQAAHPDRRDRGAAALPRLGDGHRAGHPADARLGVLPRARRSRSATSSG